MNFYRIYEWDTLKKSTQLTELNEELLKSYQSYSDDVYTSKKVIGNFKNKKKYFAYYIVLFTLFIIVEFISSVYSKYSFWIYTGYILDDFFQTVGFIIILSFYINKKYLNIRINIILRSSA